MKMYSGRGLATLHHDKSICTVPTFTLGFKMKVQNCILSLSTRLARHSFKYKTITILKELQRTKPRDRSC